MSKKTLLALVAALAVSIPAAAFAQIGIGARVGTIGLGGEVAVGVGSHLAIRGGLGMLPSTIDGTFSDISYSIDPPSSIWNIGVDLYPGLGSFHLSAGLLNRKQYDITADKSGDVDVGDQTYQGDVHLEGFLANAKETAPYIGIGFGRVANKGIGLFFDIGAAQMGDANIEFTNKSTCTVTSGPGAGQPCPSQNGKTFQQSANDEATKAEEDVGTYLKWHPILQIGLRFGFGK